MKKPGSTLLFAAGALLATAVSYDSSLPTRALGLPVPGAEAVVAAVFLSLSAALFLLGILGLRKRVHADKPQRPA